MDTTNNSLESRMRLRKKKPPISKWLPLNFTLGVWCVLSLTYILASTPALVPLIYVAQIICLFSFRLVVFCGKNWHHFLLDICYWSNLLLVVYIVFLPKNERLFHVVFALNNGVVVGGGLFFKPSLVFHDAQYFISWYMHIVPAVVTYCIRNYPKSGYVNFDVCFSDSMGGCLVLANWRTLFWHTFAPCMAYSTQTVAYLLWVWVWPHHRLRNKPGYTNTFLWLQAHWEKHGGHDLFYRVISCQGKTKDIHNLLVNYTFATGFCMWCLCFGSSTLFAYRHIHEAYVLSVLMLMTYFGGTYYGHVIKHANKPPNRQLDPFSHDFLRPRNPKNLARKTCPPHVPPQWNEVGRGNSKKDREEFQKFLDSLKKRPNSASQKILPIIQSTKELNSSSGLIVEEEDKVQSMV